MGQVGTDTFDFGADPGAEDVTKLVTVSGLSATSHIEAWFHHGDTTANNGTDEHEEAAALCPLACKYVSATQFEAKAMPLAAQGVGQFKFHWAWSD